MPQFNDTSRPTGFRISSHSFCTESHSLAIPGRRCERFSGIVAEAVSRTIMRKVTGILAAICCVMLTGSLAIAQNATSSGDEPSAKWEKLDVTAADSVTGDVKSQTLIGQVWVEAVDGSLLFCDQMGHLHLLKKDEVLQRSPAEEPLPLLSEREQEAALEAKLRQRLPEGFRILKSRNYVFCYWTDQDYAQWVSVLFERLRTGFTNFWENRGFDPEEPDHPQIVLIFANQTDYARFARVDMNAEPTGIIGYYHMLHNWVVMYDLTASGEFGGNNRSLNQALSHPNAIPMVATIVHEATHQIMFNNGMQTRLADIPLWVSEGLAVYFEAPDLTSKRGWKGIGRINILRYQRARQYLLRRPADSLQTMVQDDTRFRDPEATLDAYAEAWAFNFFLLKRYRRQYQQYLTFLSEKSAISSVTPEQRIADLEHYLEKPLADIDREFVAFLSRLR